MNRPQNSFWTLPGTKKGPLLLLLFIQPKQRFIIILIDWATLFDQHLGNDRTQGRIVIEERNVNI